MSKWIYTDEDGERVIVDLTDEEAAAVLAAQKEDVDEEDDDPEPPSAPPRVQDTPEEFERVEAVYRKERAAIRASRDPENLATRRVSLERVLRDGRQSNIAHTRSRDLLGEIEQRELKLRAERLADRRH
jgi:hypothetical protein